MLLENGTFVVGPDGPPSAATGNSSDKAINQLIPGLRPQGTDAFSALAGDGTLILGPDGRVRIQAS